MCRCDIWSVSEEVASKQAQALEGSPVALNGFKWLPDSVMPFLQRVEVGPVTQARFFARSRNLPDSALADLIRDQPFDPIELRATWSNVDFDGQLIGRYSSSDLHIFLSLSGFHCCPCSGEFNDDSSTFQRIVLANVPDVNEVTFPPNPVENSWFELFALQTDASRSRRARSSSDRKHEQRQFHVKQVCVAECWMHATRTHV